MGRWMDKAKEMEAARKAAGVPVPPIDSRETDGECYGRPLAKFTPGQQVLITDNLNRVRTGVIQFADWLDEPLTAKGWWYCIIDVYGHLSETHESRLTDAGLIKKASQQD